MRESAETNRGMRGFMGVFGYMFCGRAKWAETGISRSARSGIDDGPDLGNPVDGETALAGVLAHGLFVHGDVNAIELVVGDVALDPLHARAHFLQHVAGFSGKLAELGGGEFSDFRNFTFND